jgi:hypothetical protein
MCVQGDYSLSVKYQIVKHIKINQNGKRYDLAPDAKSFPTIQVCVAMERWRCMTHSVGADRAL